MVSIPVTAFAHLNAEKGALYRAILGVFVYERARFTIALRPLEIAAGLAVRHAADPDSSPSASDNELAAALEQLVAWNNLLATRDTADVATVEEFYRPRYLYQFSAEGEAAEHAIAAFFQHLHRPGELQVATLRDLLTLVEQLAAELAAEPDRDRVHLAFQTLVTRPDTCSMIAITRLLHWEPRRRQWELRNWSRHRGRLGTMHSSSDSLGPLDASVRSCDRVQRSRTSTTDDPLLFVLRTVSHTPLAGQRHADSSADHAADRWQHRRDSRGRRTSSSIRTPRGLNASTGTRGSACDDTAAVRPPMSGGDRRAIPQLVGCFDAARRRGSVIGPVHRIDRRSPHSDVDAELIVVWFAIHFTARDGVFSRHSPTQPARRAP